MLGFAVNRRQDRVHNPDLSQQHLNAVALRSVLSRHGVGSLPTRVVDCMVPKLMAGIRHCSPPGHVRGVHGLTHQEKRTLEIGAIQLWNGNIQIGRRNGVVVGQHDSGATALRPREF